VSNPLTTTHSTPITNADRGYEPITSNGAKIRADVVDVYVFTRTAPAQRRNDPRADAGDAWPSSGNGRAEVQFLQLLRSGAPLDNTWQPVMGHANIGETSVACAWREMHEELGLSRGDPAILGVWALEQVHPFYIASIDTIVMSPRFCCEVRPDWSPTLNEEHTAHRWVREQDVDASFMWPGQKAVCREIIREIVQDVSLSREGLRIDHHTFR
jgi:8-oxo-dGTP pyrophosphatase MutT (NUDIX family)